MKKTGMAKIKVNLKIQPFTFLRHKNYVRKILKTS